MDYRFCVFISSQIQYGMRKYRKNYNDNTDYSELGTTSKVLQ